MSELTYEAMHEQVRMARLADDRTPRGIRLGQVQVDLIQKQHRALAGLDDVGPLTEFMGMPVLSSRSADRMVLEYEGDPEDADAPTTVNVPPPPEPVEQPAL